jgi:hypothetical protein
MDDHPTWAGPGRVIIEAIIGNSWWFKPITDYALRFTGFIIEG